MSSRPILQPQPVITNGSMATSLTSIVTVLTNISMMSYSYSWTGTAPIGEIIVEVSNDYSQNADGSVRNAGIWNELPLFAPGAVSGATGTGFIDIDQIGAYAIRTRYIRTSGTGVLNATFKAKVA